MKKLNLLAAGLLLSILLPDYSKAQTFITDANNPVVQNFNSMGTAATAELPAGWKMSTAGTGLTSNWNSASVVTVTTQAASSGSPSTGGRYNWATTGGTDRAVGFITSGSYASPNAVLAWYRNASGSTIQNLNICFSIERYRVNTATASVAFCTSLDGITWIRRIEGDVATTELPPGSNSHTFASPLTISRSVTIYNMAMPNNSDVYFKWIFTNTGSTNSQGLGLDDVSVGAATTMFYPATNATDLSQPSQWTTDPNGGAGMSPADFMSPSQMFLLNDNVSSPTVNGPWTIAGGSKLMLLNTNPLIFTPASSFTVGAGSLADFNDKPVRLQSASNGTAFIGTITGVLSGATKVTVERFISSLNNKAYRLLSPSVNTTTSVYDNWQESGSNTAGYGTHITGSTSGANGFDATQTGQGSMFTYNPITPSWDYIPNTNATMLDAKKGYLLYIRGDRTINLAANASSYPGNNTTLRATGSLLTGTQNFTGLTGNNGFSLIANPYAAAINWASVYSASTGLTQFYTLWDPNIGAQGGYVTVNTNGIKSNASSNATVNIQSGQAFFVQAAGAASPEVTIEETHKSGSNHVDVFRSGSQTEMFTSSLFYTSPSGNRVNADGVTSVYHNDYDTEVDGNDATQLANWDEDIAIINNGKELSIESRPLIDETDTIRLTMARLKVQNYEWEFRASDFNHPNLNASLVDHFLNTKTPISLNGTTIIPFSVTSDAASSAADRFMIVFATNRVLPIHIDNVKAYQKGKDIQVEWMAAAGWEMEKFEIEKSANGQQFNKVSAVAASDNAINYSWLDANVQNGNHFYRIKAMGKAGEVQYSKVVRVNMGQAEGGEVVVYPNPVKDNRISISFNLPKGKYAISLTNKIGQEVFRKEISHAGGGAMETIELDPKLSTGVYQLTILGNERKYVQQLIK